MPVSSAPRIVVVGSTNTDLVARVPRIPRPGETILSGANLQTIGGGKGANQAVACARLGASVTFVARVGDDSFGQAARAALEREQISTEFLQSTPSVASGVALIAVDETTGQNAIVVVPGANAFLSPEDVEAAAPAFDTAQAIVISLEIPIKAAQKAAEMGAARKIPVILNPAPAQKLPDDLLVHTAILTPNETEAAQIAETDAPMDDMESLATHLLTTGVGAVVLTLGAVGCVLATPDGVEIVPAPPVRATDTTAAGDCFTGALASEIARGKSLRDAVVFGQYAAALSVTRSGAQNSLPTRTEVEAFLKRGLV